MIEMPNYDMGDVAAVGLSRMRDRLTAADALVEALEAVEWDEDAYCLWCNHTQEVGHGSDCQRQKALRKYREVSNG